MRAPIRLIRGLGSCGIALALSACAVVPQAAPGPGAQAGNAPEASTQPQIARSVAVPEPEPRPEPTPAPGPPPEWTFEGELIQGGYITGTVPDGTARAMLGEQELDIAEDGGFFAAFDRNSPAALALSAILESGDEIAETLTIAPRDWQIQRVDVARRPSGSSAAFMKRRRPELEAIYTARAQRTGASGWSEDFIWPVKGRISGLFGRQRIYRGEPGSYHSGIDIAPGAGTPFVSPASGVVVLARTGFSLEGGLIIIDHGMGLNSAFLHASRLVVEEGDRVEQGQHIGNVGASGRATGPHLHWSLKWTDARLDPLLIAGPMD